ncbi:MAG: citramalate synthase [Cystobacterineae bacterium]|nr:citramalate synthase [Cystobacterineae bacterium]
MGLRRLFETQGLGVGPSKADKSLALEVPIGLIAYRMSTSAKKIFLYDTTLRDGTQGEEINFTANDKLLIAQKLMDFGIDCVEGGWPGSNPRDIEFFELVSQSGLPVERVSAFGSTRRARATCETDESIQALVRAHVPNLMVVGKSWDLHVRNALGISLEENLELIFDTLRYLKTHADRVFFDAEHFFDGYIADPSYALKTLEAAKSAGAHCLVLCETNGGRLPNEVERIVKEVQAAMGDAELGIHCHNDSETGVANSLAAVLAGVSHVQGTINGYGERCGNANLCSIIPNLQLKLGFHCVEAEQLKQLQNLSGFVAELGNIPPNNRQPYVGRSAFAHKGGIHVSAVLKDSLTYEHIAPELVGNRQRVLVSDLSGRSNLTYKASEFGLNLEAKDERTMRVLERLKVLENQGFQYEGAEASFEILMRKAMGQMPVFFELLSYSVLDAKRMHNEKPVSEATVMLAVEGEVEHTAATGNGPVNALDNALRKALLRFFPVLGEMQLVDYKVRILSSKDGTQSLTRVLICSRNKKAQTWGTVGVATNIIDASYQALVDAIEYMLLKEQPAKT